MNVQLIKVKHQNNIYQYVKTTAIAIPIILGIVYLFGITAKYYNWGNDEKATGLKKYLNDLVYVTTAWSNWINNLFTSATSATSLDKYNNMSQEDKIAVWNDTYNKQPFNTLSTDEQNKLATTMGLSLNQAKEYFEKIQKDADNYFEQRNKFAMSNLLTSYKPIALKKYFKFGVDQKNEIQKQIENDNNQQKVQIEDPKAPKQTAQNNNQQRIQIEDPKQTAQNNNQQKIKSSSWSFFKSAKPTDSKTKNKTPEEQIDLMQKIQKNFEKKLQKRKIKIPVTEQQFTNMQTMSAEQMFKDTISPAQKQEYDKIQKKLNETINNDPIKNRRLFKYSH